MPELQFIGSVKVVFFIIETVMIFNIYDELIVNYLK